MPDNQTIYWAVGRLSAGLTGVGLSLWMAVRLFYAWDRWRTTGGSLPRLIVQSYHPFFALAGILFLVLIAVGSYYIVITGSIPDYIAGPGLYVDDYHDSIVLGEFAGGVISPLLLGTAALVWAVYLALRLVANAVKFFLRQDGVIK